MDGGIAGLLGLIALHRGALEYDWRARFPGQSVNLIGQHHLGGMTITEAARLARVIESDPSSQVCAAVNGWRFPVSREAIALADLYDLQHFSKVDPKKTRPEPYPRAWPTKKDVEKFGDAGGRSPAEIVQILREHGIEIEGEVPDDGR